MATVSAQAQPRGLTSSRYQAVLVGLLGVNLGVVFLDRIAFGLLAPMIQPDSTRASGRISLPPPGLSQRSTIPIIWPARSWYSQLVEGGRPAIRSAARQAWAFVS